MTNYFLSYDRDAQATIGSARACALVPAYAVALESRTRVGYRPVVSRAPKQWTQPRALVAIGFILDPRSGALGRAEGEYPLFR